MLKAAVPVWMAIARQAAKKRMEHVSHVRLVLLLWKGAPVRSAKPEASLLRAVGTARDVLRGELQAHLGLQHVRIALLEDMNSSSSSAMSARLASFRL